MKTLMMIALAGLIGTAHAQPLHGGNQRDTRRGNLHEMLNLDDATTAKMEALREDHQKKQIALRARLQTARVEMRGLMNKDDLVRTRILSKQKEISGIQAEMKLNRTSHRLDAYQLLTPEQQKIWKEHSGKRHAFRERGERRFNRKEGSRRGSRGGRGGGRFR